MGTPGVLTVLNDRLLGLVVMHELVQVLSTGSDLTLTLGEMSRFSLPSNLHTGL